MRTLRAVAQRNLPIRVLSRASEDGEITEVRARYGALGVPRVMMSWDALRTLPLDPRLAYVLSCVDGQSPVETLVDVTGFTLEELLGHLAYLVQLGALELAPPG
jgi:hypothetical protein